eukprot:2198318-Prorocentrum_lima.AAC.1
MCIRDRVLSAAVCEHSCNIGAISYEDDGCSGGLRSLTCPHGLLLPSAGAAEAVTDASRNARYGLRAVRVGEAAHPGPAA